MKEWVHSYGYLLGVLAAVIVIFVVVLYFAARAYSKHMSAFKSEEAEIKRLTALKEKYRNFDENVIANAPKEEILEGVALIYQLYLQKKENIEEEFFLLKNEQQLIYVLDVFVSDGSLKMFFSENTDILRSRIVPALQLIGLSEEAETVERIRKMYDVNEVQISYSENDIEKADAYIAQNDILSKIKLNGAEYILENISLLKMKI